VRYRTALYLVLLTRSGCKGKNIYVTCKCVFKKIVAQSRATSENTIKNNTHVQLKIEFSKSGFLLPE